MPLCLPYASLIHKVHWGWTGLKDPKSPECQRSCVCLLYVMGAVGFTFKEAPFIHKEAYSMAEMCWPGEQDSESD